MRYYKAGEDLIQYNPETNVYKKRNNIQLIDTRISKEVFDSLTKNQIGHQEFCRLMNIYFKDIKHEWKHDHSYFRKLDNFETDGYSLSSNYVLGRDVPYHTIEGKPYFGRVIMVYHWGHVYYHTISYNGYAQGQLINPKTLELVSWARLKNCAPIFNEGTKK